jgi:hypothetical protein
LLTVISHFQQEQGGSGYRYQGGVFAALLWCREAGAPDC